MIRIFLRKLGGHRPQVMAGVLVAAGVALAIAGVPHGSAAAPMPAPAVLDAPADPTVLVFVSGAVAHPGLYRLSPDARVADAVAAAGGLTAAADPGRLPNLGAKVRDGHQVNVPFARTRSGTNARGAAVKVDLNSAGVNELRAVPGMPAGLPEAIVDYRARFGPFGSLNQMRDALGLDPTLVTALRGALTVIAP